MWAHRRRVLEITRFHSAHTMVDRCTIFSPHPKRSQVIFFILLGRGLAGGGFKDFIKDNFGRDFRMSDSATSMHTWPETSLVI